MSVLIVAFIILSPIFWVWALIDMFRSGFQNSTLKLVWIILIFLFPVICAILYFQFGKKYTKKREKFNPDFNRSIN